MTIVDQVFDMNNNSSWNDVEKESNQRVDVTKSNYGNYLNEQTNLIGKFPPH